MPSESRADEMSSIASSSNCDHRTSMESLNSSHDETSRPRKISYDATEYVQKARVTKAAPPPPAYNPMQFVATKPVKLYQTAQEQAKRAEELKKTKEVKKEDAEEWQSNLDNWKSSRRKRVEHIIDRVVEVKKLELVDHDRNRKKSKTLSEMMEQRGGKKKINVPIYTEDENNDFSDLGIGTSSTSGKSSLSEDGDNHSVMSDNQEAKSEKSLDLDQGSNSNGEGRGYISSPGYDTSSSNAPASSPDPSEYTYEAAIQNYKNRVSMASQSARKQQSEMFSKDSTPERSEYVARKRNFCFKIEDRLLTMEMKANGNELEEKEPSVKKDLPKVDISKRRELFEKQQVESSAVVKTVKEEVKVRSIKERMSSLELSKHEIEKRELKEELPFEIPSIRERFVILEKKVTAPEKPRTEVLVSASVKERLSNLQSAAHKGPAVTVAASDEEEMSKSGFSVDEKKFESSENFYTDHEDSGFITTDVLSGVSHAIGSEPESDEHVNPRDDTCEDYQTNGLPVPDIVPRSEMQVAETPAVEVEPPKEDPDASVSVSHEETLLLDVKQLIDNLASDSLVEGGLSNHTDDPTTCNTSAFDETTATEDSSLVSLASPFHQPHSLDFVEDDVGVAVLATPTLNLNLSCVKEEEASTHEIILDYFGKNGSSKSSSLINSRASSPRSPTRSILNFIKSNLLHSSCSTESLPSQEKSKFYVPLEENIDHIEEKSCKLPDSILRLETKVSTDSRVDSEIDSLLEEEISKL